MSKLAELQRTGGANAAESIARPRLSVADGNGKKPEPVARLKGVKKNAGHVLIDLDQVIADPGQPRQEFDIEKLAELAESLKSHGQIQAITVRWDEAAGKYVVISGERRFRASKLAGLATIQAKVAEDGESLTSIRIKQLVENCQRDDLKPMERARAFRTLQETEGWSGAQLARELATSEATVSRSLALLGLPEEFQGKVASGEVSPATAYEVTRSDDPVAMSAMVVAENLTRGEVAALNRPMTSLRVYAVYVSGNCVVSFFVGASSQKDAEVIARSMEAPETVVTLRRWLDDIPKGYRVLTDPVLIGTGVRNRKPDANGQTRMPAAEEEVRPKTTKEWTEETPRRPIDGQTGLPLFVFGVSPPGHERPLYFVRAANLEEANKYVDLGPWERTGIVTPWEGDVPDGFCVETAGSRKPAKVETLDDTKIYDLGQGVIVVIEGPREMIACPEAWLELLVKAIDERRVDAKGRVIPKGVPAKPKKARRM